MYTFTLQDFYKNEMRKLNIPSQIEIPPKSESKSRDNLSPEICQLPFFS